METTRDAYKEKMEAQLKQWTARIAALKAKAEKASADVKIELSRHLDELKVFEASARKHIAEVESSAVESWHTIKGEFEQRWNQLSGSIEAVWAKIATDPRPKT